MADNETELNTLFKKAIKERSHLPDDLAVRMMTDAEAVRLERKKRLSSRPVSLWRQFLGGVGGWQGMGGLVAACATGVWVGFAAPDFLPDPADFLISQETTFLVAELDLDTVYMEDGQ